MVSLSTKLRKDIFHNKLLLCFWFQNYFMDRWNVFDFVIVLGSIVDITMNEVAVSKRGVGRTLIIQQQAFIKLNKMHAISHL